MKETEIKNLIELVGQPDESSGEDLKKIFDWYNERKIMVIKGTVGVAISLIVALLVSYYKDELKVDLWQIWITFGASVVLIIFGIIELLNLKKIGAEYMAAKGLLNKLNQIKPFIILYRKSK
jgi:uncharacterized protein YacL